ncbi:RNA methyltransferase family protein [Quillaja saponaria]|uniref:RNA methyltransferase family protein n=1 Tax=Quillaja saponaria TaxID=32244 RepID=A0AAD7PPV2_QUISA|nr:RNA methyltransferase family protein [Quillaja saponaria]
MVTMPRPSQGFRYLSSTVPYFLKLRTSSSLSVISSCQAEDSEQAPPSSTKSIKPNSYFPKRGQTLELVCHSLAFKGKGLCKVDDTGFVVMCDRALPGERFIGRVTRKKGNYAEVTKLRAKEEQVHELVIHVGKFSQKELESESIIKPIVPCDIQFHYRNKMEFSFGHQKWVPRELLIDRQDGHESYALGLHAPGFFDKVLNVDKCLLQADPANMVLAAVQDCWRDPKLGLSPYNVHCHSGFLKHLMLRAGRDVSTGLPELMVNFVTSSYKPELLKPLVDKILDVPEVMSIMNNVNTSVGNTSVGEEEHTLYGKSSITEILRGLTFQISANSFFQTNTCQAEVLYKLIEEYARIRGDGSEIVLDLFCGTGTIGLTLARSVRHVMPHLFKGISIKLIKTLARDFPKPDIVISDPNRPGMHMKLIKFLLNLKAPRIVYVSCNPSTCARDLDYLCHGVIEQNIEGCYKLKSVQPVDMFPHTPHIECVCLLEIC